MARELDPTDRTRASDTLLVIAVLVTLFVLSFGSTLLWRLYESYSATLTLPSETAAPYDGEPLVICVARTPGGPAEWITYAKVFAKLERDLERPVHLHYALDRAESQRMLRDGEADLAFLAVQDYFRVRGQSAVRLVAAPVIDGQAQDAAVLVVSSSSDILGLDDLRGTHLVVADDLAGAAYAQWLFDERGQEPLDRFFREVEVSGVQDTNLTRVASGQADATCVRRSALSGWPRDRFRVLSVSPEFGVSPLAARADLDAATLDAIQRSLLSSSTTDVLPPDSGVDGFLIPQESDYDFARMLFETRQRITRELKQGAAQ